MQARFLFGLVFVFNHWVGVLQLCIFIGCGFPEWSQSVTKRHLTYWAIPGEGDGSLSFFVKGYFQIITGKSYFTSNNKMVVFLTFSFF